MEPKSAGEVDRENTKPETMELTELSTVIDSLTPSKTKAEASSEEEEEEEEVEEEEEEEEEEDSCEEDQEWDVDSFKDVEYPEEDPEDEYEWRRYVRQCYKSEGFDVPYELLPTSSDRVYKGFYPCNLEKYFSPPDYTGRQYMQKMLDIVITKYNQEKKKSLKSDHIVRAVVKLSVGCKAYITFMAKESPEDEELVEYQAKAGWKAWQNNIHPILCRPASQQRKRD